ncbi:hypothetical protein SAMN05444358_11811 [Ruegeria halocynthiae]|uniref:Uncharacterized protein n=1 Tax=Ruegeria halocynthiae TaxID=985054 RepID=A0A1H3FT18_9RHOB|nr:hypothetical protein [Ruegeria halocynthiae]SDX94202.1 hypothetical protein SAMN05444358_11811 [Ruegeria halocynthiae]
MPKDGSSKGLDAFLNAPLARTLWNRRTKRVSRGSNVVAGSLSWKSENDRSPLSPLQEAILIAATGASGMTMPDRPFFDDESGNPIMSKPNLLMEGRTAGSPDNAQGTHFFMINDSGTYFLRRLDPVDGGIGNWTPEVLIDRAEQAKVQILDRRLDVPGDMRDFPAYLDANRFLSNTSGSTMFFPVVDLSHQYINALMYLLTQPDKARPVFVDDRNFYQPAGVKKWIKNGFLNPEIKIPLGMLGQMRTQIEADLLVQNLFLVTEAMGLGGWVHAAISPPVLMGDPKFSDRYGKMLHFDYVTPKWRVLDLLRWHTLPVAAMKHVRAHAVGLRHHGEHLIKGKCPPYYQTMSDAVDAVVAGKFGPDGIYKNEALFDRIYKGEFGRKYLEEAGEYEQDVIECARDICNYIHKTHGRFPAHCEAIHAPGIWLQAHRVENEYYDTYFDKGLTAAQAEHDSIW